MGTKIQTIDSTIIRLAKKWYVPIARIAFFIIFFYFGILKIAGLSSASPLAHALTERTVGLQYFDAAYITLAFVECLIGILFLIPQATRIVIALLFIHMAVVCSPLILVPEHTWSAPFVPNLEGQYIIKNIALIAVAVGIAAHETPLANSKKRKII